MDNMLVVFACIALGALATLCVVLAVVASKSLNEIRSMTATLQRVGTDVHELRTQMTPLIEQTTSVVRKADRTLDLVEVNLQRVERGTEVFEQIAGDVRMLEQDFLGRLRQPLEDLTTVFSGAIRGVSTLVTKVANRWM